MIRWHFTCIFWSFGYLWQYCSVHCWVYCKHQTRLKYEKNALPIWLEINFLCSRSHLSGPRLGSLCSSRLLNCTRIISVVNLLPIYILCHIIMDSQNLHRISVQEISTFFLSYINDVPDSAQLNFMSTQNDLYRCRWTAFLKNATKMPLRMGSL